MKRLEIKPGMKFNDMEVISELPSKGKRKFLCRCHCGQKTEIRLDHLRTGHTTSCGRCGLEYRGVRKTLTGWAESVGINESTLRARLKVMSLGEALRKG
jgi:hypothetical protein